MAIPGDIDTPCLKCETHCKGFKMHKWRSTCGNCDCPVENHAIVDERFQSCLDKCGLKDAKFYKDFSDAQTLAKQNGYSWIPVGLKAQDIDTFVHNQQPDYIKLMSSEGEKERARQYRLQVPVQDRSVNDLRSINDENEKSEVQEYVRIRNNCALGVGYVDKISNAEGQKCAGCTKMIHQSEFCIRPVNHSSDNHVWHTTCFRCSYCREQLIDNIYCWQSDKPYCVRHYGQLIRPRCAECDELIFSDDYARAMDQDHHPEHFACKNCDKSLTGHRYILKDDHPYCLSCYEEVFANTCELCKEKIGCDSKDLSYKERHWHEKCFNCSSCSQTLVDKPFATRDDALFCSDCYDEKFAARCDGCSKVFKAGMRKFEYRGKQWHEECFTCSECKQPIGSKSFVPREQLVVCVPCFEEKYAQRCTKCKEVIRRGGVTYKGEPWHKECFACTQCTKQLAGIKFISKDDKPYCAECYGELFAKKCCQCTKPITGIGGCKFISFEDRHWHSECFNCSKCATNLVGKGFLTCEDKITCPDCGR